MMDWREGHALLTARQREVPTALARTVARPLAPLDVGARPVRRVVATGVGSSAAHAALLVHELRRGGRDAAVVPLSAFLGPPSAAPDDVLVVFSQGLSPNARLALDAPARWRRVVLVTAVTDEGRLAPLRAAGIVAQTIDGEDEFGTLVRVVGPMTGSVAALRLAEALGGPTTPDLDRLGGALATLAVPAIDLEALDAPLALVTTGTYGELVANLQYKIMEGMLLPMPPVWDVLHLPHGPYQQRVDGRATFLALGRPDAPGEADLLDRFASMLDPARHTLVRFAATLPAPLALFEHEAMLNAVLLRWIEARGVDQVRWPGRGADAPLYALADRPAEHRLARSVWPEIERHPPRLAIVPLGATEQHGPHLPFATDTLVADALAARLAARLADAVALPAIPVGCSVEHMGFPGTLDLAPPTLVALVTDLLRALARHGVGEALVFSAHGGNVATLREATPALEAAAPGLRVVIAADLDRLTARLHAEAARFGVGPEAAGHHAGEVETSIMLALHPELVRTDALAPGWVGRPDDPQGLFYPDLRRHAADGTVGDPRGATAVRGERYLAVWVDVLEAALRDAKNVSWANGTKAP
jgi:creatinine amidohydrolase